jgi:hypothetical protein
VIPSTPSVFGRSDSERVWILQLYTIGREIGTEICSPADSGEGVCELARMHYYCQWGCWHSGRSTADRACPGRSHMEQKVPLEGQRRYLTSYASPIPTSTEVLGNVGMWGIGKSENFLWFYSVYSRILHAEGGHASDGGANAVLGLAIPVDPILPRCPCMCVEEDHMRSLIRCQVRFLAHFNGT